jgi:hypothetical protein
MEGIGNIGGEIGSNPPLGDGGDTGLGIGDIGGQLGEEMDMEGLMGDAANQFLTPDSNPSDGVILDSGDVADENNQAASYLRITADKISLLVNGKHGIVITKDNIKISGDRKSNSLTSGDKGPLWEKNVANMTYVPSTFATPMPVEFPRNPLGDLSGITSLIGG